MKFLLSSFSLKLWLLIFTAWFLQISCWKAILPSWHNKAKSASQSSVNRSIQRFAGRGFRTYAPKYAAAAANNSSVVNKSSSTNDTLSDLLTRLKSTNIYLVGMMGSGKSTLSKSLAKKLGYRPLDTDTIAEYMCEMPIHQFFKEKPENEAIFRNLEYQILMETSKYTRAVVATGGGIVIKPENWGVLHHGLVIFLNLSPEDILTRLERNPEGIAKRPLLASPNISVDGKQITPLQRLHEIYQSRKDLYHQADVVVDIDPHMTVSETTDLIIEKLLHFVTVNPPQRHEWKKKRDQRVYEMAVKGKGDLEKGAREMENSSSGDQSSH